MDKNNLLAIVEGYDKWEKEVGTDGKDSYKYNGDYVELTISPVGIERPGKPQARISCSGIGECKVKQAEDNRFFLFGVCNPSDPGAGATAPAVAHYKKYRDWVVSVEGISTNAPQRFDIVDVLNAAIDYFDKNANETYIRIKSSKGNYQFLSVFKPVYASDGTISYPSLEQYLQMFDNRPYRTVLYNAAKYIKVTGGDDSSGKAPKSFNKNWLVSGAPGTGKSFMLDQKISELISGKTRDEWIDSLVSADLSAEPEEAKVKTAKKQIENEICKYVRRITFYEDYAYENFVGCYKPVPDESDVSEIEFGTTLGRITGKKITYEFSAGPFIETLCDALNDIDHSYVLVIEEINRARAASVFGDMFLALDRDKDGNSVYYVTPVGELDTYLKDKLGARYDGKLRIPFNMYIWATMNSADQGVFYMDSAFKRRWNYTIRNVFESRSGKNAITTIALFYKNKIHNVLWDDFRALINKRIASIAEEDCFVGPWYLTNTELEEIKTFLEKRVAGDFSDCPNPLVDKLMLYLRQDIFRNDPSLIFKGDKDKISMSFILNMYSSEDQIPNIDSILDFEEEEWEELFSKEVVNTAGDTSDDNEDSKDVEADSGETADNADDADSDETTDDINDAEADSDETTDDINDAEADSDETTDDTNDAEADSDETTDNNDDEDQSGSDTDDKPNPKDGGQKS